MSVNYGFADEHGNLIDYVQLPNVAAARDWARAWLDAHPDHRYVQVWEDGSDEESLVVSRTGPRRVP